MGFINCKSWERPSRSQCHGRPTTAVTQVMLQCADKLIQNDRQITARKLVNELWVSKGSVNITDALGYSKVCGHLVSQRLNDYHKTVRIQACSDLLTCYKADGKIFLSQIITFFHPFKLKTHKKNYILYIDFPRITVDQHY